MINQDTRKYIRENFGKGRIVCLTGAGISSQSGIPTFRGKGGLWEKYDPQIYANTEGLISTFRTQPAKIIDFVVDFYSILTKARPNPAHLSLALLEKQGILSSVITQNIDNLHQEAGARNVIELHGNAYRIICPGCQQRIILEKARMKEFAQLLQETRQHRFRILKILSRYFPRCKCGSRFRIDIVLFGEMLPQDALSAAYQELDKADTLLIIGSSLVVYPAAGLPLYAKERGAKLIEINNEPTAFSEICDYKIRQEASEVLPEFLKILD